MRQPIAEPVGMVVAATVGRCGGCGGRITRLLTESGRWRHDDDAIPCDLSAAPVVAEWRFTGGRDDPPFDDLVKGGQA